jgi:glycosyltransferase involved in cell wall biosynthesis
LENLPLVSICCITYNHEKYIAQAIDSFLMQETDFDVEIVIGDDCSTDATPLIIEEYRLKYPGKIRVLPRKKNLGSEVNFIKTIQECNGKYVALCEGDDYWTDSLKLEKQVKALEDRPTFSICVTKHSILDEESGINSVFEPFGNELTNELYIIKKKSIFSPYLFQTHTILFKKKFLQKKIYKETKCGDVFIAAELLSQGNGIYIPEDTGTYRKHAGGMFSKKNTFERYSLEFIRSKAMNSYFRATYPEIKQLHLWNREKLLNHISDSNLPILTKLKWRVKLLIDKKLNG